MGFIYQALVALVVACCACAVSADTLFRDPLDTPALHSDKAGTSLLVGVTRTPGGRWVAVGRRGHVLWSDDAHAWHQAKVPVSVDLVAVSFPSAEHGWAVGHGGVILRSLDGGRSWDTQLDGRRLADLLIAHWTPLAAQASETEPGARLALQDAERFKDEGPGRPFLDVAFIDEQTGYAVGAYNLILMTTDAGAHWQVLSDRADNPSALHLNAVRLLDRQAYLVGEQGLLLHENPATGHFEAIQTPYGGTWFGLLARPDLMLLFGLRGTAYASHDQGASWTRVDTGTQGTLNAGASLADGRVVLVTAEGRLLLSDDASAGHFRAVPVDSTQPLYGIATGQDATAVAVGAAGVRLFDLAADAASR